MSSKFMWKFSKVPVIIPDVKISFIRGDKNREINVITVVIMGRLRGSTYRRQEQQKRDDD